MWLIRMGSDEGEEVGEAHERPLVSSATSKRPAAGSAPPGLRLSVECRVSLHAGKPTDRKFQEERDDQISSDEDKHKSDRCERGVVVNDANNTTARKKPVRKREQAGHDHHVPDQGTL